ncbi:SpaA isopeptide-forming pilin-related protein [Corynebacterium sp. MNWGS58]|uniref:SpaA isopeptide-forming pilin-related protein n=1 Tax=Corynebacterium sp. 102791.4 TaxID=3104612 RepID=UPI003513E30C
MFSTVIRNPALAKNALRVFSTMVLALVLILGTQVVAFNSPSANAQAQVLPSSPAEQTFRNARYAESRFTVDTAATITELSFTVIAQNNKKEWIGSYELDINGTTITPQFTQSSGSRQTPMSITHKGLNIAVPQGAAITVTPRFNRAGVNGSLALTISGKPAEAPAPTPTETEEPTQPLVPDIPDTPEESPEEAQPPAQDLPVVTPAPPTLVDPATAPQCVEKAYINIPDTRGVDYSIDGEKKPAGQHVLDQNTRSTVKVRASAQANFRLSDGEQAEWSFDVSGETKDCSHTPDNPGFAADVERLFEARGHDFSLAADAVDPRRPNTFTARVTEDSRLKYTTVRIETDREFLEPQKYGLTLDRIEDGVTLHKRNVNIGDGFITMDVFPMKNGKPVDSALAPKDAVFTFTNNLAENRKLKVTLDVYGVPKNTPEQPQIISPPDGAHWVHGRVPNPPMPQRCGLRVAVVADFSTSLKYADTNAFIASRNAANNLIDALAGTPAEIGLYNFATRAPQVSNATTHKQNPAYQNRDPYISLWSAQGVTEAKGVVSKWTNGSGSTNWEAGLLQVADGNYDVVYFITDGMPTFSSKSRELGLGGEFVQASALNQAIDAANDLKKAGTRIVPIMVDLTLGNPHSGTHTVTEDLVLKDVPEFKTGENVPAPKDKIYHQATKKLVSQAAYPNTGTHVNFQLAVNGSGIKVYEPKRRGGRDDITKNRSKWTYGPRGVKTMGEDISGTGDTVRVEQYSELAAQLKEIGKNLSANCEGHVQVKKRIVDENGTVLTDGAPGWEFTLSTDTDVIETLAKDRVRTSIKTTSGSDAEKGKASWNINSNKSHELSLTETQKPGYSLFHRGDSLDSTGDSNAVCTEKRGTTETKLKVENNGEFGFKVQLPAANGALSLVSCVVDNYEVPNAPPGKLTLEKAAYNDGNDIEVLPGLGGAHFAIYPSTGNRPDFSVEPVYTIIPGQESVEITTTGTFYLVETQAPSGFSLLPAPVPFEIGYDKKSKKYTISVVGGESHLKCPRFCSV